MVVAVNQILQDFVTDTCTRFEGRLRSTDELFDDRWSTEQFLDAAVIGGYGLRDILAGGAHDSQISPAVIQAFHQQYPHAGGFVDFVRSHNGDEQELLGIVNGIKGKVFELEYLDYLNQGHLPTGAVAEMATSPTQEGWDIAIRDAHGHIIEYLQLKATESMSYVADAIAHHPEIDVVATHEVFQHLDDPEIQSHVIDSGISNEHVEQVVADNVHDLGPEFEVFPLLAYGVIAAQGLSQYKQGVPLADVLRKAFRRGAYATVCRGAAFVAELLGGYAFVGFVSSVLMRLNLGRYDAQKQFLQFARGCREAQKSRLELLKAPV